MQRKLSRSSQGLFEEEEINPMSGVSNLADVMLVLAVGIMLALIINWHISVSGGAVTQMEGATMTEVDASDYEEVAGEDGEDSNMEEKGTVYVDKKTGKMYLVEPAE